VSQPYRKVTRRDPWQERCDLCAAPLSVPFYYGAHKQARTICAECGDKAAWRRALAIEMNSPEPPDPRYA